MTPARENSRIRAIIVSGEQVSGLVETLFERNISAIVFVNADEALEECRVNPPHLAIVSSSRDSMTGIHFVAELLKISWTISTILISDEEEETLHDRTEGLGILGAIKSIDDTEALDRLLNRFFEILTIEQQSASGAQ